MSKPLSTVVRWGVLWRSKNRRMGRDEYLKFSDCRPLLFYTRREARQWIETNYGYIRIRPDLRTEPHGWRMPKAVRVLVTIERMKGEVCASSVLTKSANPVTA